jgi:2-keto-3-deoxy-L-rhamnonate aldolase RhmA
LSGGLLEKRIGEGRPAFGVWVTMRSPDMTEVIAASGVDWIVIDLEHSDIGYADISDHLRAASASEATAIVRIPHLNRDSVQRALDLGAHGVMIPMIRDADDVAAALRSALYPPVGERGVSPARANVWRGYTDLEADLRLANDRIFVIPMFETRQSAENVEEMLSQPGVRAAFVGLADLSASYGDIGGFGEDEQVSSAVDRILAHSAERGIAVGAMATSPEDAKRKADAGYRMIGLGSDVGLFAAGLAETVAAVELAVAGEGSI